MLSDGQPPGLEAVRVDHEDAGDLLGADHLVDDELLPALLVVAAAVVGGVGLPLERQVKALVAPELLAVLEQPDLLPAAGGVQLAGDLLGEAPRRLHHVPLVIAEQQRAA
jgi:hypothetical protein